MISRLSIVAGMVIFVLWQLACVPDSKDKKTLTTKSNTTVSSSLERDEITRETGTDDPLNFDGELHGATIEAALTYQYSWNSNELWEDAIFELQQNSSEVLRVLASRYNNLDAVDPDFIATREELIMTVGYLDEEEAASFLVDIISSPIPEEVLNPEFVAHGRSNVADERKLRIVAVQALGRLVYKGVTDFAYLKQAFDYQGDLVVRRAIVFELSLRGLSDSEIIDFGHSTDAAWVKDFFANPVPVVEETDIPLLETDSDDDEQTTEDTTPWPQEVQ